MRRSDRFFEIIQIIRDGRLHRAGDIAEKLEVSLRTIYRDMETLMASGIPIEGERGLGYLLREPIALPPVSLSYTELEALHLGMAIVAQSTDDEMRDASHSLLNKINQVTPDTSKPIVEWGFGVYLPENAQLGFRHMAKIRKAIHEKMKLAIEYKALDGAISKRTIWPLQIEFWGQVWTCTGWCESRGAFRVFRIDRIEECQELEEKFQDVLGRRLMDYLSEDDEE